MSSLPARPTLDPRRTLGLATALLTFAGAAVGAHAQAAPAKSGPVVFVRSGAVVTMPATGGVAKTLAPASTDPDVSPDGRLVAYAHARDIWTMRRDGSAKTRLTTDGRFNQDPAWSPDGKRLVFSKTQAVRADLYAITVKTGKVRQLTATADHGESDPAVSPDGSRIAYDRSGCEKPRAGGTCVYVMGADGRGQANLTPELRVPGCEGAPGYSFHGASADPAWSPDGTRIAFRGPLTCRVGTIGADLWTMAPDGSAKLGLTRDDRTDDAQPAFSPDGRSIVVARPGVGLFTVPATGGALTRLATGNDSAPEWAPPAPRRAR